MHALIQLQFGKLYCKVTDGVSNHDHEATRCYPRQLVDPAAEAFLELAGPFKDYVLNHLVPLTQTSPHFDQSWTRWETRGNGKVLAAASGKRSRSASRQLAVISPGLTIQRHNVANMLARGGERIATARRGARDRQNAHLGFNFTVHLEE